MMRKFLLLALVFSLLFSTNVMAAEMEIEYWTHTDANRTRIENRYIEEFEAMHPDVKIKRVVNEASKLGDIVLTAFSANNGPDIFNLPIEQEYSYMINGRVAPVDYEAIGIDGMADLKSKYAANTFDPVTMNGEVHGLPLELTNWSIYLNKQIFRDAGLDPEKDYPKTWEEMADISEKLVIRDGDILVRRGFDFRYPYYLVSFLPMVEQLGGKLISEDGTEAIVNRDAWIEALTYMKEWGPYGRNLGNPTYTNARKTFNKNNNDIAMALSGFYQQGRIKSDNPEFYESGDWMVIPFPVFEDAVNDYGAAYYGHYMMVNSQIDSEKQKMAWKFIDYMLSHPEEYLLEVNIIQPRKDLVESEMFKDLPYTDVFMDDLERSKPVFLHENGYQMERYIKSAVEEVMLTNLTVEEALETLEERVDEVINEY